MEVSPQAAHLVHLGPGPGQVLGQGQGGDLNILEAEISELQRENARVESQMLRLRTDISAMEAHLRHDKEPQVLAPNLTDYYESLRNNVMSLLEHVRIPNGGGPGRDGVRDVVREVPPHFDSYLSKLQTLCEEGHGPLVGGHVGGHAASGRTIYGAVRSTLPTPI